ncbi:MAG: hydroxymethylbilane synthase [Ignavibacteriae bacterium]|nr:hydroxymethylbilane synthase [Ignavibacteriota bacterium]
MKRTKLVIGSRGSELARWQTDWLAGQLRRLHPTVSVEVVLIKTTGDKILDSPLSKIGGKGLFTKEIEKALLDGTIDLAVHSLKDLPTVIPEGLTIGAVTEREDVRDVFISHPAKKYSSFKSVPVHGIIATGSLRRRCQLLHHRPDLTIVDLRGNLRTRREKLSDSDWDGMILARAGLLRLGWTELISEIFEPEYMLPAVGQGALGVEIRDNDKELQALLAPVHHHATAQATSGERALLRELEGGCQIPIGTFGTIANQTFQLHAMVGSLDGTTVVRGFTQGPATEAEELGKQLAHDLVARGAGKILEEIRNAETTPRSSDATSTDV